MTLETLDVKLHFFFFSWPAPYFLLWDYCFHKMARRENILFQVSWELLLRGISFTTCTYQSRIWPSALLEYGGKKGEISLDLTPRCRQNGCHCAPTGIPLWLNATYSNQSTPLLAGSKDIFIDTLVLTLAQGSVLSAGGPGLLLNLAVIFSA